MKVRTEVVFCHILAEDCKTKDGAMSNKNVTMLVAKEIIVTMVNTQLVISSAQIFLEHMTSGKSVMDNIQQSGRQS